jgi:ABC transporter with metal-binding/Fe-S-binding domain ATP-binding protein
MVQKKCAALFSGGKDSCLALHLAKKKGYDIKYLLAIVPKNPDSFMFHKPYLELLEKQAEMLGIKLLVIWSKGEKEKELIDLSLLIGKVKNKVDAIVVGGIASSYQSERIKKVCSEFGLKFYAPIWDYSPEQIWKELLEKKFKVILTKISCEGLGKDWLGVEIDKKKFNELKELSERYKFRIDFEGGEAETAVLGMPEFKKDIDINYNIKSEGKYRHWLDDVKVK